jgi:hypothetical protein
MQTFSVFKISYSSGLWAFKITTKVRSKSPAKKKIFASVTNINSNFDCFYSYDLKVLHLPYMEGSNTGGRGALK